MTKASDNPYPSILIEEATEPAAPAAGHQRLYIDSTSHKLKRTDSSAADVTIEGGIAETLIDAKGDLIVGSAVDTAARLAVGTDTHVLTADAAATNGVKWAAAAGGGDITTDAAWAAKGDLIVGTANNTAAVLTAGTNDYVLTAASGEATGLKWAAVASAASEWDTIIVKASNDTVTNSAALVSDSELTWAVDTGEAWRFKAMILYQSDATGDYKCDFAASAGNFACVYCYLGSDNTSNSVLVSTGIREAGVASLTDIAAGGGTTTEERALLIEGNARNFSEAATMSFRSAQNTQTNGQNAVTLIGSMLMLKKLM